LTLVMGTLVTVNSPESVCEVYDYASRRKAMREKELGVEGQVRTAAVSSSSVVEYGSVYLPR
jgi:hypothetical protein